MGKQTALHLQSAENTVFPHNSSVPSAAGMAQGQAALPEPHPNEIRSRIGLGMLLAKES